MSALVHQATFKRAEVEACARRIFLGVHPQLALLHWDHLSDDSPKGKPMWRQIARDALTATVVATGGYAVFEDQVL